MANIRLESDIRVGAKVIVTFREDEIDKKALYTLINDPPSFILPFNIKNVDGQIEMAYLVGNNMKFAHLSGRYSKDEYIGLWISIVKPLIEDCNEWFLKYSSFVIDLEYMFYNKNDGIKYIYIPTKQEFSNPDRLRRVANEISSRINANDLQIENSILRELNNFELGNFLKMLKTYKIEQSAKTSSKIIEPIKIQQNIGANTQEPPHKLQNIHKDPLFKKNLEPQGLKNKEEIKNANASIGKQVPIGTSNEKQNVFQNLDDDIIIKRPTDVNVKEKPNKEKKRFSLFGNKEKNNNKQNNNVQQNNRVNERNKQPIPPPPVMVPSYNAPENIVSETYGDVTEIIDYSTEGTKLRYIGYGDHDKVIGISIDVGQNFLIGRHDKQASMQQCNFEFNNKTKAVSRKHAIIERTANGYFITDLNSSAGTFLNDNKIHPNAPFEIKTGYKISFGNAGAVYIFEE